MKKIILFTFSFLLISCASKSNINEPKRLSSFSIKQLKEKNIVEWKITAKGGYYWTPYFYDNKRDDFIELYGDYYKVSHPNFKEVLFIVGFDDDNGNEKNALIVYVWAKHFNNMNVNKLNIIAHSSKFGRFTFRETPKHHGDKSLVRYFLSKRLDISKRREILDKIKDDKITIEVNGYIYEFLSPEYSFK